MLELTLIPESRIIIGYDFSMTVNLTDSAGGPLPVDLGATVAARLVTADREDPLSGEIAVLSGTTGANWLVGKLVVIIPNAVTADLRPGSATLELSVTNGVIRTAWSATGLSIILGHVH